MRIEVGAAALVLLLGVTLLVVESSGPARAGEAASGASEIGTFVPYEGLAPADAAGAGFGDWWAKHGQQVAEFAGCMVDGAGLARLLVAGVTGVGGLLTAAGLIVGAVACLT